MTTIRQINKLSTPLLERHEDLVLVANTIIVKPVHHILRGVLIDRTGEANRCKPRLVATALFVKLDFIPVRDSLHHPRGLWWLTDPDASDVLIQLVEGEALPKLQALATIRDYAEFAVPKDPISRRRYAAAEVLYLLALGDLEAACGLLASEKRACDFWRPHLQRLGLEGKLSSSHCDLDASDRRKLAALFHEWEVHTIDKLKIGHIWEPTPFPLEFQG